MKIQVQHFYNRLKLELISIDRTFLKDQMFHLKFLVACYATLHSALLVRRLVGRLDGRSVGPLFTFSAVGPFFYFFGMF